MIQKFLPDNSGNAESLKKILQQFESFSTNVSIVGEDLLRARYRLFYLQFYLQVISEKTLCSKGFISNLRDIFT